MVFLRAASLAFIALLTSCQTTPAAAPLDERLFLDMVLADDSHRIYKWEKGEITIGIGVNNLNFDLGMLVGRYLMPSLQKIQDASGLTFSVKTLDLDGPDIFDIKLFFIVGSISDFVRQRMDRGVACTTNYTLDDYDLRQSVAVVVPIENAAFCLEHELLHALGVWHAEGGGDTVMLDKSHTRNTMSEFDKQLLSILYNKDVKAGMTSEEVLPVARRLALRSVECQGSLNVPQCLVAGVTTDRRGEF